MLSTQPVVVVWTCVRVQQLQLSAEGRGDVASAIADWQDVLRDVGAWLRFAAGATSRSPASLAPYHVMVRHVRRRLIIAESRMCSSTIAHAMSHLPHDAC